MKTQIPTCNFERNLCDRQVLSIVCAYFPNIETISSLVCTLSNIGDVVIVNNGGLLELEIPYSIKNCTIINADSNLGTLASYNLIINNYSNYEYFWLWDQDTGITLGAGSYFINKAINIFDDDTSVACVTAFDSKNFVCPVDKKLILAKASTTLICKSRMQAILQNCFDEKLFMDYGDWEFFYRLFKAGGRLVQIDGVDIAHQLGESEKTWFGAMNRSSPMRLRMQGLNTVYLIRKHGLFNYPNFLLIARLFFVPLKNFLFKNSIKRSSQFLSGVRSGIKGELSSTYAESLNRSIK
jgi:GT2 family glycosyltransferase